MRRSVKTYRIPGRVFYEKTPGGEVVERNLFEEYRSRCS
jgi:AMMECR1 domain-containing protein